MLADEHKLLLLRLARTHEKELREAHQLARAHLDEDHFSVQSIGRQVEYVHATVEALEREPTRQVA